MVTHNMDTFKAGIPAPSPSSLQLLQFKSSAEAQAELQKEVAKMSSGVRAVIRMSRIHDLHTLSQGFKRLSLHWAKAQRAQASLPPPHHTGTKSSPSIPFRHAGNRECQRREREPQAAAAGAAAAPRRARGLPSRACSWRLLVLAAVTTFEPQSSVLCSTYNAA